MTQSVLLILGQNDLITKIGIVLVLTAWYRRPSTLIMLLGNTEGNEVFSGVAADLG